MYELTFKVKIMWDSQNQNAKVKISSMCVQQLKATILILTTPISILTAPNDFRGAHSNFTHFNIYPSQLILTLRRARTNKDKHLFLILIKIYFFNFLLLYSECMILGVAQCQIVVIDEAGGTGQVRDKRSKACHGC